MWTVATFEPVSFFSLKLATATSTGGKSLLAPTPFAVKMALLDVVIRTEGLATGRELWPVIRDAAVALDGPQRIVVNNTFTKILKPPKNAKAEDPDTGLFPVFINTIAFREYVHWQGRFRLAIRPTGTLTVPFARWLCQVNYLGKRGGFIQSAALPVETEELPDSFTVLTDASDHFMLGGTMQLLDDCGAGATFAQIDIYSDEKLRIGKERVLRQVVLPYRTERASRGYTLYQRIDAGN